jgi:hypothetical protein
VSRLITWLPIAQLLLSLVILGWNVVLAGRIAQLREAPRAFAAITGLAGLLLLPALLAYLASSSIVTGRAIRLIDWIWPLTLVLFAVQALYALFRRLVNPTWGVPIAIYDVSIAMAGLVRYLTAHGVPMPDAFTMLLAAQSDALALATASAAFASPLYLHMPMIAPAFPALRNITASFRAAMAAVALGWLVMIAVEIPRARLALASYAAHRGDRLQERAIGDFQIGIKILPDLASPPPSAAIRYDIALADTIGVDAVSVVVVPDITSLGIDSLAHVIEQLRRDSTTLIVTLGYRGRLLPDVGHVPLEDERRLDVIRRVVQRLRPSIIVPAEEPFHLGERLVGPLSVRRWERFLTNAARAAKATNPNVRVGVAISAFDTRDSALYAWAAAPGSPIDVVGLSFFPTRDGMNAIDARMRAADRWMRGTTTEKPHWVFSIYGYPLAHGEKSQDQAIWGTLAWATSRDAVKGVIIYEAGDYGLARGLRAPSGRPRQATSSIMRAVRGLREASRP